MHVMPRKIKVKTKQKPPAIPDEPTSTPVLDPTTTSFLINKTITASDNILDAIKDVTHAQNKNSHRIKNGTFPEICTACNDALPNFMIPHLPSSCPVLNSLYCSFCSRYGHSSKKCTVAPPPWAKDVVFMEQLIPTNTLKEYKIKTKTLLSSDYNIPTLDEYIPNSKGVIELREDDKLIKAWLKARGISATENYRRNRELLQQYADSRGLTIVYLP